MSLKKRMTNTLRKTRKPEYAANRPKMLFSFVFSFKGIPFG
jgi:hypothetical protein